jgi:hypothetical protein
MSFPKPPKTEKKCPRPIKRTAIVRKLTWKPLRRSSAAAATPARRSSPASPLPTAKPPKRKAPIQHCPVKAPIYLAAAEAKRLARKAKRKSDRAIASHGKWPVVDGVMFIPDPFNPRGQREICLTDAAWARTQGAIRMRSKDRCEDCNEPAPNGDAHHICGRPYDSRRRCRWLMDRQIAIKPICLRARERVHDAGSCPSDRH